MKKTIRILAVFMIIAMLSLTLVACAKTLNGKWVAEGDLWGIAGAKTVLEFSGKNVTRTITTNNILTGESTTTEEGTYEIMEDNKNPNKFVIVFTFDGKRADPVSFSEGKNADGEKIITIGGVDFKQSK